MSWESDNRRRTSLRRRRKRREWRLRLITGGVIAGIIALIALSISLVNDHKAELASAKADAIAETQTSEEAVAETEIYVSEEISSQEVTGAQQEEPYVVVVDAGHGGKDQGCAYADVIEKDIILPMALCLQEELETLGVEVIMTREDDTFLYLNRRVEAAQKADADAFISIHIDSFESDESVHGLTIHHQDGARGGKVLATLLHDMLAEADFEKIRDVHASNLYVLRNTTMPAVLIEAGFATNQEDREKLKTEEYKQQIAQIVAEGIVRYLNENTIEKGADDSPGDDMVIDEE